MAWVLHREEGEGEAAREQAGARERERGPSFFLPDLLLVPLLPLVPLSVVQLLPPAGCPSRQVPRVLLRRPGGRGGQGGGRGEGSRSAVRVVGAVVTLPRG